MKKQSKFYFMFVLVFVFAGSLLMVGCTDIFAGKTNYDNVEGSGKTAVTEYEKGYRFDENGWIYIHIEGDPFERGKQYGYLVAPELGEIIRSVDFLSYWNTGKEWSYFVENAESLWADRLGEEYMEEIKGIAAGAEAAGVSITWQEVLAWNGYEELTDYWWPNELNNSFMSLQAGGVQDDHCSAFMATGDATEDGQVVVAHNSWAEFETGQFNNEILDIVPTDGHRILMQSLPGYIHSQTDFFVTEGGLLGTETTIGGFSLYDPNEDPEFLRIRKAMQYSNNLDDFVEYMKKKNNGGYANAWLVADLNTNEIMRHELGLNYDNIEKKTNGYFIGFNAPLDPRIRGLETSNSGYADIRRHQGARQVRLTELMEENYGTLNVEKAKEILADHYDVYLEIDDNPSSRTVDGHYELDAREYMSQPGRPIPYEPRGTVDGKVANTEMGKNMSFWARWGNSSGMPFDASEFLAEHIQFSHLDGYLNDRPSEPWTEFKAGQK